jgi:hypothetical protein
MYYPKIPAGQNAAIFFQEAFSRMSTISTSNQSFLAKITGKAPKPFVPFTAQERSNITALLGRNSTALELLHRAPTNETCRYPLDFSMGYNMPMPHLRKILDCEKLLALEAAWHGENGDTAQALDDLGAALRLSDSLTGEPAAISQLVRLKCEIDVVSSLERILNQHPLADDQLAGLARELQKFTNSAPMLHAMAGEMCMGVSLFDNYQKQLAAAAADNPNGGDSSPGLGGPGQGFFVLKWSGFNARDLNYYLATMDDYLAAGRLPFPEKLDAADQVQADVVKVVKKHWYFISSLALPAAARDYSREAEVLARLNILQTVFAIEQYRLASGDKLPETLADLTPAFLPAVPTDPFDGRPLRYKKLSKGYLVYSIGRDRKDDGGVDGNSRKISSPEDITFTVGR